MTITNRAPYEDVPGFPSPSPSTDSVAVGRDQQCPPSTNSVAMAMDQPRPSSTCVTAPVQRYHSGIFEMSMTTEATAPLNRTSSEPSSMGVHNHSAAKLPGKEARLSRISERSEKRRLSKKEKKFQLSKDDGSYSELKPINPHEARKEFGDTLKLNPVGPAFQAAATVEGGAVKEAGNDSDHVTTAHNVVASEGTCEVT